MNDRLRILIFGGELGKTTGYTKAVLRIARGLGERNEVFLVPYIPRLPTIRNADFLEGKAVIIRKRLSSRILFKGIVGLVPSIERNRPYLTGSLMHSLRTCLNYAYNKAYASELIGKINPDVINIQAFLNDLLPFYDAVFDSGIPTVATSHGLYSIDPDVELWFSPSLEKDLHLAVVRSGGLIATVSSGVKEKTINTFGIPGSSISVVLNGIDTSKFALKSGKTPQDLRSDYGIPNDKTVLLSVGSVQKRKNQKAVIDALASMSQQDRAKYLYVVVGGGKTQELCSYADERMMTPFVRIVGKVTEEVLVDYYHLADFFILTSTSEGFGLVFLEAMAVGLPIITFADLEAVRDVASPNGFEIAVERSPDALAAAIIDASNRCWDRTAIQKSASTWDWGAVCERYEEVFREAIDHTKKSIEEERHTADNS